MSPGSLSLSCLCHVAGIQNRPTFGKRLLLLLFFFKTSQCVAISDDGVLSFVWIWTFCPGPPHASHRSGVGSSKSIRSLVCRPQSSQIFHVEIKFRITRTTSERGWIGIKSGIFIFPFYAVWVCSVLSSADYSTPFGTVKTRGGEKIKLWSFLQPEYRGCII